MVAPIHVPGYPSVSAAADAIGVSRTAVRKHLREFGNLDRLRKEPAPAFDPIPMPDGTLAPSIEAAAARLGVTDNAIRYHLQKHGHLRFAGSSRRVRTETTAKGAGGVTIPAAPWETVAECDPRAETAPRGSRMVATPTLNVRAVIATIRACLEEHRRRMAA